MWRRKFPTLEEGVEAVEALVPLFKDKLGSGSPIWVGSAVFCLVFKGIEGEEESELNLNTRQKRLSATISRDGKRIFLDVPMAEMKEGWDLGVDCGLITEFKYPNDLAWDNDFRARAKELGWEWIPNNQDKQRKKDGIASLEQ